MRKHRLRIWFIAGFLLVFMIMSFTVTKYSWHPSGRDLISCKLWQYYLLELRRAISAAGSTSHLGPATGSTFAAFATAFGHVLCSTAGGFGMLGIGWAFWKLKDRQRV